MISDTSPKKIGCRALHRNLHRYFSSVLHRYLLTVTILKNLDLYKSDFLYLDLKNDEEKDVQMTNRHQYVTSQAAVMTAISARSIKKKVL